MEWPQNICGVRLYSAAEMWGVAGMDTGFALLFALLTLGCLVGGARLALRGLRDRDWIEFVLAVLLAVVGLVAASGAFMVSQQAVCAWGVLL